METFINLNDFALKIRDLPDYGKIFAGFPTPAADDYTDERFDLENFLFGSLYKKVLFRVVGESMMEAGILEDDIAIVEKGITAKVGDIVIAFVDGKYSIKYLQIDEKGKYFLRPANKDFKDIYPEDNLQIFGVVTSIVRKLK